MPEMIDKDAPQGLSWSLDLDFDTLVAAWLWSASVTITESTSLDEARVAVMLAWVNVPVAVGQNISGSELTLKLTPA